MKYTTNLKLKKPELTDVVKIDDLNSNMDTIDEELGSAGYGDMTKGIYDTNNNGKVDMAEVADSVPWTGVIGKPNVTNNDIQLGNYKLVYSSTTNSLDIEVIA